MTTFAENHIVFPDGQINVVPLPEAIMRNGFTPETRDAPGMPLPAQYLNWLMRDLYRLANEVKDKSEELAGRVIPAWMPIPCPLEEAPEGYLKCNGAAFDKERYPELAEGYPSGVLPDLRGEFIRGWDDGRGVDAGRKLLSAQDCAMEKLYGNALGVYTNAENQAMVNNWYTAFVRGIYQSGGGAGAANGNRVDVTFDSSRIVKTAAETRPRNVSFSYIVRAA